MVLLDQNDENNPESSDNQELSNETTTDKEISSA